MDSCHLFNFLFGTKRATTELSRCLSSLAGQRRSASKRSRSSSRADSANSNGSSKGSPGSPLKQLQAKIANLGGSLTRRQRQTEEQEEASHPNDRKRSISCDAKCSTYRATLVATLIDADDEDADKEGEDRDSDSILTIHTQVTRANEFSSGGKIVTSCHLETANFASATNNHHRLTSENSPTTCISSIDSKQKSSLPILRIVAEGHQTTTTTTTNTNAAAIRDDASDFVGQNEQLKQSRQRVSAPVVRAHKRVVLYDDQNDLMQREQQQPPFVTGIGSAARVLSPVVSELPSSTSGGDVQSKVRQVENRSRLAQFENGRGSGSSREKGERGTVDYHDDDDEDEVDNDDNLEQRKRQQQQQQVTGWNELERDKWLSHNSAREPEACESARDKKRSAYVRTLVQSIESSWGNNNNNSNELAATSAGGCCETPVLAVQRRQSSTGIIRHSSSNGNDNGNSNGAMAPNAQQWPLTSMTRFGKPVTFVKPLPPPKTPPRSNKAAKCCLNLQLAILNNNNKPAKIEHLFQDERFLTRFFDKLEPLDRCVAAQVCRLWRKILYANRNYWKDLVNVIDCSQLRREYLVECIISALQSAKMKQLRQQHHNQLQRGSPIVVKANSGYGCCAGAEFNSLQASPLQGLRCSRQQPEVPSPAFEHQQQLVQDSLRHLTSHNSQSSFFDFDQDDVWRVQELCNRSTHRALANHHQRQQQQNSTLAEQFSANQLNSSEQQQQCTTSKSSSIPSQISSTVSSVSLSSLLSPLSESSRLESLKEKLYTSLDDRGFDAICFFGATDDDIDDLVAKIPDSARNRIVSSRLKNSGLTDQGLELFVTTFSQIQELELCGCCEITNSLNLKLLTKLKKLTVLDCIKISDAFAERVSEVIGQLEEFTLQGYHCSDTFLTLIVSMRPDLSNLRRLELQNCREITNHTLILIAKHLQQLETLSLSGATQITDEGIEILAERAHRLKSLDLSWCARITDGSLECIACDLGDSLMELILDRLTLLHIRWCPRITDIGLESVIAISSLKYLSLAGIHQITARSLLALPEATQLLEVELTNCPAVNSDLVLFLSTRMPKCNVIF